MGPEMMLVNVTSQGRIEPSPPPPQNPAWGSGERGVGGRLALARSGLPLAYGGAWEMMA